MYTDTFWKRLSDQTSQPAVLTSLKSIQVNCPTVMLMLCQRYHDLRTMCITIMIFILGDVVYVTWETIILNTSVCGDHVGGGGHQG